MENKNGNQIETRGRKNIINRGIVLDIVDYVKQGMPKTRAAAMTGIAESTLYSWLEKARDATKQLTPNENGNDGEKEPKELTDIQVLFVELMEGIEEAEAAFMLEAIEKIKEDGPGGYRWLLSRLFRKEFGESLQIEPIGDVKLQLALPGMGKQEETETKLLEAADATSPPT